jgi:16S rRNA G966 N2-methylase RsmD
LNKSILYDDVQKFISNNLEIDVFQLILKKQLFTKVSNKEIAEQITAKNKSKNKLPSWYNTSGIYFPNKINIEQTSSELTAEFKSGIVSGDKMIDCTGGFGVDSFYFSRKFKSVTYIERAESLCSITKSNSDKLGIINTIHLNEDGLKYAQNINTEFDLLYIDPSRRDLKNKKVHFLNECTPAINYSVIKSLSNFKTILIKCSPIIDLKKTVNDLEIVKEVYIIGVNNEVKEVLIILNRGDKTKLKINCIDLSDRDNDFIFDYNEINNKENTFTSETQKYLYEPNSMILKSGAFNLICDRYKVNKLNQNSHLYTSNELTKFPGRMFEVERTVSYNKKNLKSLNVIKANITTRNFPIEVKEIRRKNKIKDGGEDYLFFTTNNLGKLIIIKTKKKLIVTPRSS